VAPKLSNSGGLSLAPVGGSRDAYRTGLWTGPTAGDTMPTVNQSRGCHDPRLQSRREAEAPNEEEETRFQSKHDRRAAKLLHPSIGDLRISTPLGITLWYRPPVDQAGHLSQPYLRWFAKERVLQASAVSCFIDAVAPTTTCSAGRKHALVAHLKDVIECSRWLAAECMFTARRDVCPLWSPAAFR
jgi:hypothetical protein